MYAVLNRSAGCYFVAAVLCCTPDLLRADTITLRNGMILEGSPGPLASVGADPLKPAGGGEVKLMQILVVDNQLTRTFVPTKQLAKEIGKPTAVSIERIPVPQRVPSSGLTISSVGLPLRDDPFDEWGRRIFSMENGRGRTIDLVQGITEVTPKWTKVEAIQGLHSYIWPMRIATSAIPREQLSRILYRVLPNDPDQRIRIVRLYMQMERYQYARQELDQIAKEFPKLDVKEPAKELRQLAARRLVKEIDLRLDAGQFRLGVEWLEQFPGEGVAGETLLKVREMLDEIKALQQQGQRVLKLLDQHVEVVKDDKLREELKPIVAEIKAELNINTLDRMADYLRLTDDPKSSAEQKLSLAISGWLLGSGAGLDNLAVSNSLVKVRDLVRKYLVTTREPERKNLLSQLTSLEGATHEYIAAIIAHMKPPVETEAMAGPAANVANPTEVLDLIDEPGAKEAAKAPPVNEQPAAKPGEVNRDEPEASCGPKDDDAALLDRVARAPAPKSDVPAVPELKTAPPADGQAAPQGNSAEATTIPGLFKLTVNSGMLEDPLLTYWVQLPPEYDPYRRYPTVVTLNGIPTRNGLTTPLQQIDWWAGNYSPAAKTRVGQATRHGYIVIAPQWMREHQRRYEYSSREHGAVLVPLRDACKRFAIDVDRVFISGHSIGGDAAWDIGLSHPDLWAGSIPIVATAGKYITQYWKNGKYIPMYFVGGEKDGRKHFDNATDWDRYLKYIGYDAMVVEYQGRGHEGFHDEIQNLFTWMNLHKRDFFPREFTMESLRPWDNFFWWVTTTEPKETNTILPAEWGEAPNPAKKPMPADTTAKPLLPNGVSVVSRSCAEVNVWLSPELVQFNDSLKVTINNDRFTKIKPEISVLLEDVRRRGDRQHPFWAKVEWRNR